MYVVSGYRVASFPVSLVESLAPADLDTPIIPSGYES